MSEYVVRIERLANGFEVEMTDPKIVEENNRQSKGNGPSRWKDPNVGYMFKTAAEVCAFLEKNLDKAMPMNEYESSFDEATKEMEDD